MTFKDVLEMDNKVMRAKLAAANEKMVPYIRARLGRRHSHSNVATPSDDLMLHAKAVQTIKLDELLADARPHVARRLRNMFEDMRRQPAEVLEPGPRFLVPASDVEQLQEAGVIEPFAGGAPHSYVRYFSVKEILKMRRRPIMWPFDFLRDSSYVSELTLPSVREYTQKVLLGKFACCFDLASSFWQVPLPDDVNFIMKDASGAEWRVTRVPFGVDCGSEILQLIVEELAFMAVQQANVAAHTCVHVDNAMCIADSQELADAWAAQFKSVCAKYNVTLNDEPELNAARRATDFAGIHFDFRKRRVSLRESFVKSLPELDEATATFQDLERAVGKLVYGLAVLQIPMHRFHFFFKWFRRQLAKLARGDATISWRSVPRMTDFARFALRDMLEAVAANRPALVHALKRPTAADMMGMTADDLPIIVTDATLTSCGAVIYERGQIIEAFGMAFGQEAASMAAAESAAVLVAIERYKDRIKGGTFVLLVDNSTTELAVRRGHAKAFSVDLAVAAVEERLRELNAAVLVSRVSSGDNVADAPSRGKPLSVACVAASKAAADEAVAIATSVGARRRAIHGRGGVGARTRLAR